MRGILLVFLLFRKVRVLYWLTPLDWQILTRLEII